MDHRLCDACCRWFYTAADYDTHRCYRARDVPPAHPLPIKCSPAADDDAAFPLFGSDRKRQYKGVPDPHVVTTGSVFGQAMERAWPNLPATPVDIPAPTALGSLRPLDTSSYRACVVTATKKRKLDDILDERRAAADTAGDVYTLSPGGTTWTYSGGTFAAV